MSSARGATAVERLGAAACAGMFLFGIVMALLGAILPLLSERLHFGLSQVGSLFLAMNLCMLLSSLALGPLMDRFGLKPPLAVGPLLIVSALVVVTRATAYAQLVWAVALLGCGGGAVNGAANTLVADLYQDPKRKGAALNLLGVFFGFGALFIPLGLGLLLEAVGLVRLLLGAGLVGLLVALHNALVAFPPPKQAQRLALADVASFLRSPLVLLLGALLFFQSGSEFVLGGYVSTLLTSELRMSLPAASYALAAYWAAMMAARAVLSRALLHVSAHRLVLACAAASAMTVSLLAAAPGPALAVTAVVMTGAALAGIFPTVLGIAGGRFASHSGTVFGILFTMALSGGMTIPWLTGLVATRVGLRLALGLTVAQFLAVFVIQAAVGRIGHRPRR
jgi:FHS family glucose/mannose:H+ symporter-like MFS transporter